MSLATLKKKTASKYKNNSVSQAQFSINGTHRNQGYVGQTSLSRTILRTPANGVSSQGHGGCCGTYLHNDVKNSTINTTENSKVVKSSVLGTKGMLQKRTQWARRPAQSADELLVKPGDGSHLSSGNDYIVHKRKTTIAENTKNCYTITFTVLGADTSCNEVLFYVDNKLIDAVICQNGVSSTHSHKLSTIKDVILVRFEGSGSQGNQSAITSLLITGVNAELSALNSPVSDTSNFANPNALPLQIIDGTDSIYAQYTIVAADKVAKDGIKCCENIVKIKGVVGAMSQGDYIYQQIAECTNFDISYVQYNTNISRPLQLCSS